MSCNHFFLLLVCFNFIKQIVSITHPSDLAALKAFKSSINPTTIPSYSCLASWNFSTDPCSLPRRTHFICGITCTQDSTRVTSLVLDPVGYSGPISPLVSSLSQLTHLDLSDNSFHGPIPPQLSQLTLLETLTLRSNSLSGSLPPLKLTSLKTLDISHNALTGPLPNTLSSLVSLRTMDLSFNKFTSSLPKLPPNLVELALKANSLSGPLTESSFHGLTQLEVVELADNMLTGVLNAWFFLVPSLQQVDLSNNSFTRVDIQNPATAGSDLVAVDLSYNKIEGYLPINFAMFPSLSSLSLRYNKLTGPIPWQFGNKTTLSRLFLNGNFLNGVAPKGFFSNKGEISGSFGDNCLQSCPVSSQLCLPSQKPSSVCRQVYGKRPRSGSFSP